MDNIQMLNTPYLGEAFLTNPGFDDTPRTLKHSFQPEFLRWPQEMIISE